MATSTDKVFAFVEQLQDLDDDELTLAFPVAASPMLARLALAAAVSRIPTDPVALDEHIANGIRFLMALRSDPPELVAGECIKLRTSA